MNPVTKEDATKLPIDQDAWLLHSYNKLEVIRLHLAPGASMEKHINDWHMVFFYSERQWIPGCGRQTIFPAK